MNQSNKGLLPTSLSACIAEGPLKISASSVTERTFATHRVIVEQKGKRSLNCFEMWFSLLLLLFYRSYEMIFLVGHMTVFVRHGNLMLSAGRLCRPFHLPQTGSLRWSPETVNSAINPMKMTFSAST